MIVSIHQPQFLPWFGYFDKIASSDVFILLDNVQFKKNEWQNRNKIKTPQGWQWLTVPILHDFGQKISEVKINNQIKWRESHLKTIYLNYKKSPFFGNYINFFEELYGQSWECLGDINIFVIKKISWVLGIQTKIVKASDYQATEDNTQRLIDLCEFVGADSYLSGRDGPNYLDLDKFASNNIKVVVQDYQHPVYQQLWAGRNNEGFVSHLAIIDLLFNYGKDSFKVLKGEGESVLLKH